MEQTIDLTRFTEAHRQLYRTALKEIRNGRKESHWMWFIFPQVRGLGHSEMSAYYAISGAEEAAAFLNDPYLGKNLREISAALLELETNDPGEVFWPPDDKKLRSCMTLFACVGEPGSVFERVLEKYFGGRPDTKTLDILKKDGFGALS